MDITHNTIVITEHDRHDAFRVPLLNIAKFHEIPQYEFLTNEELYYEIQVIRSPLVPALKKYLEDYNNWFEFYYSKKAIEKESKVPYEFSNQETIERARLRTIRIDSLSKLQSQYDNLKSNVDNVL